MVCKYLKQDKYPDSKKQYVDFYACTGTDGLCPKKRLVLKISAHCWRFK